MEIKILKPHGFCGGVSNAIKIAQKVYNKSTNNPIYVLGSLVHNKYVIKDLENKNIITLDTKNNDKIELIKGIKKGTIIITAHGVCDKVKKEISNNKKLTLVDATCPMVTTIKKHIKKYLDLGYQTVVIGNKNHEEILGITEDYPSVLVINKITDLEVLDKNKPIYITNQTTASLLDLKEIYDYVKDNFENAVVDNKVCQATKHRQEAILKMPPCELLIVVGDKTSANSNRLYEIGRSITNTIFIENLSDLEKYDFSEVKKANITSGASTPEYLLLDIVNYLTKIEN